MGSLASEHSARALIVASLLVVPAGLTASGCDGCEDEPTDEQPEPRLEIAEHFPAHTQAAVGIESIARLLDTPGQTLDSDATPDELRDATRDFLEELQASLDEDFGFDPLEPDDWQHAGIDVDEPVFVGLIAEDENPVVCLPVTDQSQFEEFTVDVVASDFARVDEPEHRQETVDGHQLHTAGIEDVTWAYRQDSACLSSRDSIIEFLEGPGDETLRDHPPFENWRDGELPDSLVSLYLSDDFDVAGQFPASPDFGGLAEEFRPDINSGGATLSVHDDIMTWRLWAQLASEAFDDATLAVIPEASVDFSPFATADTIAAMRLTLNPEFVWNQLQQKSGGDLPAGLADIDQQVEMATGGALDLEDDLIYNLGGQMGLFVYEANDVEQLFTPGGLGLDESVEALLVLQFVDETPLERSLDNLVEQLGDRPPGIEQRPLDSNEDSEDDAATVYDPEALDARLIHRGDLVVIATDSIPDATLAAMLDGQPPADSIAETDAVLGEALEDDYFNGVYLAEDGWELVDSLDTTGIGDLNGEYASEALFRLVPTDTGLALVTEFYPAAAALFGPFVAGKQQYELEGSLTQMRHWALDIDRGQQRFFSDHHEFLDPTEPQEGSREYEPDNPVWTQILEFDADVPDEVTIEVDAGDADDSCQLRVCDPDPSEAGEAWYAVLVEHRDLDVAIYFTSELDRPREIDALGE